MKQLVILPIAIAAVLAALLFTSCTIQVGKNEALTGEVVKESRSVTPFCGIETYGGLEVNYIKDDSTYIEVETDEALMSRVKTEVKDSILTISLHSREDGKPVISQDGRTITLNAMLEMHDGDVKVYVHAPGIVSLKSSGAIEFHADSLTADSKLECHFSGSSEIDIKTLAVKDLSVHSSGSSEIDIKELTASKVAFQGSGATELKTKIIGAQLTDIDFSGGSEAEVEFDNCDKARLMLSGGSDVTLKGTLKSIEKNVSGGAEIDDKELKKAP